MTGAARRFGVEVRDRRGAWRLWTRTASQAAAETQAAALRRFGFAARMVEPCSTSLPRARR